MSSQKGNNQPLQSHLNQKDEPHRVELRENITRDIVRAEKDKIFLFGDNLAEKGFGGQAKEMRGEANSIGIPTKKAPSNDPKSFFSDREFDSNKKAIDEAFSKIPPDKTIVVPSAGLGTGLAQLPQKAPKTFVYLNQKLAEIGFRESVKDWRENPTISVNKVIVQNTSVTTPTAKRLLDLHNIKTESLKILSPTEKEINALKIDSGQALADYAERLRQDYKTNKDNFRDGLRILSNSLDKGEQITIACSCRNGLICHADVVKLAVEKVNLQLKTTLIEKDNRNDQTQNRSAFQTGSNEKQITRTQNLNPRTQRAINEILSFSENDRALEKINETDGRNRSEQASYLGQYSQFTRDTYEHGANVVDGHLIVPQEKLNYSQPLEITTESYAVSRLDKLLQNEERAKELAPVVVEYGKRISGITADGETKLKIFGWMYEFLEGKTDFAAKVAGEKPEFAETLEKISVLAEEMHALEPLDKTEFVLLDEFEKGISEKSLTENKGDNLNPAEIYQESITVETTEQTNELETNTKINSEGFERVDLKADVPRFPDDYTPDEIATLINETLPEIDRQLENGITPKEILAPFNQVVRQSARDDAKKRLETIYQNLNQAKTKQAVEKKLETSPTLEQQLAKIDLHRQNIIELKTPDEFISAEKVAINTFYKRQTQEAGNLLTKIDEIRQLQPGEKNQEPALKKELNRIKEAKPNFAFKLENSKEIVVGVPSQESVETRNFVSSYIDYQLKQPETKLRFGQERYRDYAARLESAATRDDVMKTSAEIRAENARIGLKWEDLTNGEKEKLPRPLTVKEMQFLFTESSPVHYTNEMTASRLSFAHSGASRRSITESLLKGEINPSPEAQKLIESLESRLDRREIKDSLLATKHFFQSIKIPNDTLKHKNSFDHQELYQKLPPQEKDFVYQRASEQKENLEYQIAFKNELLKGQEKISLNSPPHIHTSQAEHSFHFQSLFYQARVLGERIDSKPLAQSEIKTLDVSAIAVLLKNQPAEKLENIAQELQKSQNTENKKIGEIIQTFTGVEISKIDNKTNISIKVPENSLVTVETYRELLEKFYPDDRRENDKFKFENLSDKEISRAREKGQDEALQNLREEIRSNIYQKDDSGKVIETQNAILEKVDKIAEFQADARNAWLENERLANKYIARVQAKMVAQDQSLPSLNDQQQIVSIALGGKFSNVDSNKIDHQFLQAVQKEITITDFIKFNANENFWGGMKANIKNEFVEISVSLKVLEENKLKIPRTIELTQKEQIDGKTTNQEITENKPFSLRLFEKELEKTEKQIFGAMLKAKLDPDVDLEKDFDPKTVFSNEERTTIKANAVEAVKEKLEPKELNADNRKISPAASRQAFATYKQLERATNLWQTSNDKSKVTEAFSKLDREAAKLNQTRRDYNQNEKMELLRDGIKTDLMDWMKKNPDSKQNNFEGQINKILTSNLSKLDFVKPGEDDKQIGILSRQIVEKIEAKQLIAIREKQLSANSHEPVNSVKDNYSFKNDQVKTNRFDKAKDAPFFNR